MGHTAWNRGLVTVKVNANKHKKGSLATGQDWHNKYRVVKKKKLHAPKQVQDFPKMIKTLNFVQNSDHNTVVQKDLPHINREKLLCLFRGGKFFFWPLYMEKSTCGTRRVKEISSSSMLPFRKSSHAASSATEWNSSSSPARLPVSVSTSSGRVPNSLQGGRSPV